MSPSHGFILDASSRTITRAVFIGEHVHLQTLTVSQEQTIPLTALGMLAELAQQECASDPLLRELARVEALSHTNGGTGD